MSTSEAALEADFYYRIPLKEGESKPVFGKNPVDPTVVRHYMHLKSVRDGRKADTTLEAEGFQLVHHESQIKNFYDAEEIQASYYTEMKELAIHARDHAHGGAH